MYTYMYVYICMYVCMYVCMSFCIMYIHLIYVEQAPVRAYVPRSVGRSSKLAPRQVLGPGSGSGFRLKSGFCGFVGSESETMETRIS